MQSHSLLRSSVLSLLDAFDERHQPGLEVRHLGFGQIALVAADDQVARFLLGPG